MSLPFSNQNTCRSSTSFINAVRGFRTSLFKRSRRPNSKPKIDPVITPFERVTIENGPVQLSNLWKPLGFTVLVSSGSFVCAAIWQYENMRARAIALMKQPSSWIQDKYYNRKKFGSWRNDIHNWWNGLTEGQKLFFPICFINCLVFLAWRVPQLQGTMFLIRTCSITGKRAVSCLVFKCWSYFFYDEVTYTKHFLNLDYHLVLQGLLWQY
ncbi:hypothetical protein L9F63_013502, partial [Diploptera punctata]